MAILRDMLYGLGTVVTAPYWGYRMLRTGKWRTDWRGRFGHVTFLGAPSRQGGAQATRGAPPCRDGAQEQQATSTQRADATILIHAVSVGEVNATRQLIAKLTACGEGEAPAELKTQGDSRLGGSLALPSNASPFSRIAPPRIVISTTTDTGFARAVELFGKQHTVVRYPLDFTRCVRRFLDAVRPDVVALVELEVWPTFVEECDRRGIPVCVVNGRLSARSFKRYKLIRPLMRSSFAALRAAAVQTPAYAERFIAMGAAKDRVSVTDSMKWDTAKIEDPGTVAGATELASAMGIDRGKPLIVAGSTGPGEEEMLIRAKPAGAQLLIAPRKPERFEEVARLMSQPVRRTQHRDGTSRSIDGTEAFLLDTLGELRKAYALADVAIVGRSFINLYGSDPIEPIALGKPTIIGPRYGDFEDIVNAFRAEAGIYVSTKPCDAAAELLEDHEQARALAENGRKVILSRQGATDRHVKLILDLIKDRRPGVHHG